MTSNQRNKNTVNLLITAITALALLAFYLTH